MNPDFTMDVREGADGLVTIVVAGELDVAHASAFRATVTDHLGSGVLLDLAALEFMDSSGVAALDALLRSCAAGAGVLTVRDTLQRPVRQLLEMTGLLEHLPLTPPAEEST